MLRQLAFVQLVVRVDTAGRPDAQQRIRQLLHRYPIGECLLDLGVTDDVKCTDLPTLACSLEQLDTGGARLAHHDFGRLHSPLLYLAQLPVALFAQGADYVGAASLGTSEPTDRLTPSHLAAMAYHRAHPGQR